MTREAILAISDMYDARVAQMIDPQRIDGSRRAFGFPEGVAHLRWMFAEMRTMEDVGKLNRWLGFAQGVLFGAGVFSIDELRGHVTRAAGA